MAIDLRKGDLFPPLVIDTNADVTGATAVAKLRRKHQSTVMTKTLSLSATPTDGILTYDWVAGDTDVPGTYLVQAVVTFAGGAIQTFPQRSHLELIIKEDLA